MAQPKVIKMFPPTNDRAQLQRDVEAWLEEHPEYTPEHFRIDIVRSETGGGYIVYVYSEPLETVEATPLPVEE